MNAITPIQNRPSGRVESQPLNHNPAVVYLLALQPTGRHPQRRVLNLVARLLETPKMCNEAGKEITFLFYPWAALRYQHLEAIRSKLMELYQPATVNKALAAMRGVLRAAFWLGQTKEDDYHQACAVKGVRIKTPPTSRVLTPGEIAALVSVCKNDPTPAGARDTTIINVSFTAGLRRGELSRLDLADYDQGTNTLTIHGKDGREHSLSLISGAARAMSAWLAIRGNLPGAVFRPVNNSGKIQPRRMSSQAIYNLLQKRGKEAGVKGFSPNDLRRTFINNLLEDGMDISMVAKMAGHVSVATTYRYTWSG
jgi:integrase